MLKISFFGHGNLWGKNIRERVKKEVESNLSGEIHCLIGTHGDFDRLSLSVCKELRKSYPNIKITVVFTSLNVLKKSPKEIFSTADMYFDVDTLIYDIEEVHFKNRITISNKKMVDACDLIICYVDMEKYKSGAKNTIKYALKQGKKVINLFREEDKPFYGMSNEEIEIEYQRIKERLNRFRT